MKKQVELFPSKDIPNIILCEEYMDSRSKPWVDGCIIDGQIYIWAVGDTFYWTETGHKECFKGITTPSILCKEIQNAMVKMYKNNLMKLHKEFGHNNCFTNMEFHLTPKVHKLSFFSLSHSFCLLPPVY